MAEPITVYYRDDRGRPRLAVRLGRAGAVQIHEIPGDKDPILTPWRSLRQAASGLRDLADACEEGP